MFTIQTLFEVNQFGQSILSLFLELSLDHYLFHLTSKLILLFDRLNEIFPFYFLCFLIWKIEF